uniref:RRM domain-containing protein n=1 Tax=Marmota marmota marmota TaxID=9994 RepID=A0A8C5YT34_MARMA
MSYLVHSLGQEFSESDLQNQFRRFAKVSDVEIIAQKDDQGSLQKVFLHILTSYVVHLAQLASSDLELLKKKKKTLRVNGLEVPPLQV